MCLGPVPGGIEPFLRLAGGVLPLHHVSALSRPNGLP